MVTSHNRGCDYVSLVFLPSGRRSMDNTNIQLPPSRPEQGRGSAVARFGLNAAGAIPIFGSFLAALAGTWSEHDQEQYNNFFEHWLKMLHDEMGEKAQTIIEIMARIDMHDEKIAERVKSSEFQSLVRKAFRDWAGTESEEKRKLVRNVLAHAATTTLTSDDVVRLFIEWIKRYSEFHFAVVADIYRNPGSTRADVWEALGRGEVRDDSADADLFKLLFHELTTGYIIRQHRETDAQGRFLAVPRPKRRTTPSAGIRIMKSAFDDGKAYELTELGERFVHYAMEEVPIKIEYKPNAPAAEHDIDGTTL
jgi:hypothetical protein